MPTQKGNRRVAKKPVDESKADAFRRWMKRLSLSDSQASLALGLSRNTVMVYRRGESQIPHYVMLACAAVAQGLREIK